MVGTCVTPRLITKESNRRANERKKEAWQAKANVIGLVDENRIQMDYLRIQLVEVGVKRQN